MKNFSKHIHPLRRAIVMISVQLCGLVDSPHSEPQSQTCFQIRISSEQYLHKPVTCATNDNKAQTQGPPIGSGLMSSSDQTPTHFKIYLPINIVLVAGDSL